MRLNYMIVADVLRALGWEVEINEKESYWNLVLTNTSSSEDMPESHKSCLRGLLRGWLMEFNFEGGRQQVNIYKVLHGLDPEDDRYSCLDTCANRTDSNTPEHELNDREVFVRRMDRFDRYVLAEPVADPNATTAMAASSNLDKPQRRLLDRIFMRFLDNAIVFFLYAATFCLLLGIALPTLSTREYIGYSLILGFFAGLLNNLERVMRELFEKED